MLDKNLIVKDWRLINFSFGLIFPNTYKIGMSSYSIKLLYYLINSHKKIACERIFLPEKVKYPANAYHNPKNQIRSIENRVLLDKFDILGFSLQFENDFRNILWILEDSLIPFTSQARQDITKDDGTLYPLIIAGGPVATSNPIPFSSFFDLIFMGDFEPNMNSFFNLFENYINKEIGYQELLNEAQSIEGIFVPSLCNKVKRAVQRDLDLAPIPDFQLLSESSEKKHIFERNFFIEVNRGCPFKCKFCISSFHNSPFRNRSYEKIIQSIENGVKYSDFNTISLIGACISAHPRFAEILEFIIERGRKFTIPSIRIEHLNLSLIQLLEMGGIKTITLAPETGSERLRYSIGKKISNEKIHSVLRDIKESRIQNVKFYFLIGLPGENDGDIEEIVKMLKSFNEIGFDKGSLRVNINPFIPKLNTPYENEINFFLSDNINKLKSSYQKLEKELRDILSIKLKFKDISNILNKARLQGLISLGDKEIGNILINYYLEGANFGAFRKALKMNNFNIDDYLLRIKFDYSPWKV